MDHHRLTHYVVMGVSGTGKTSLARALARTLGYTFIEGDDLHPGTNIALMRSGTPLTDADRAPWLQLIADAVSEQHALGQGTVVTCSALKRKYRDVLRTASGKIVFVHLTAPREVILQRVTDRRGHFMPPALLDSQLATLEVPGDDEPHLSVDATGSCEEVLNAVMSRLPATPPYN
ncbi:gluconokinase [Rothia sp. LK2588]|uniref:gluconokinase n=1 Tax=Rothia sp. LK2588 TaxID=3114369 RepID=UPI0034D012A0